MNQIITFGEVLMRISPPGNKKFIQSNQVEFYFGGTELNVGISVANFGQDVKHISCVSDDFIGDTAISFLRKFDVSTSAIVRSSRPLGVYFLEVGAVMRPSSISYNRSHSSFSEIQPEMVNWEKSLKKGKWFHWTSITPALCKGGYETLKEGLILAKKRDGNFCRSNLQKWFMEMGRHSKRSFI
ncbi:PfkB family carbohydrate kinase [Polaribacter sejongensis]|uniref:PfkB family carbohydrate kinase n=1 Tax=Polaribacter sejongensis TaxID=985043 RepID=UPI0035A59BA4